MNKVCVSITAQYCGARNDIEAMKRCEGYSSSSLRPDGRCKGQGVMDELVDKYLCNHSAKVWGVKK
jgi:hypothetical protein